MAHDRTTFADGSAVVRSSVPGIWRAHLPDGSPCRVPDLDRPGVTLVALFPSWEDAERHLIALGYGLRLEGVSEQETLCERS